MSATVSNVLRLNELERGNTRPTRIVTDKKLELEMLREIPKGNLALWISAGNGVVE